MTDTKELNELIRKIRVIGGTVVIEHDSEGYISTVQISGLKGVGPYPMSPIAAAERMRELLYFRKHPTIKQLLKMNREL